MRNSQELVRRYQHSQWDVEHILLALLEREQDLPGMIFAELGISTDVVKERMHRMLRQR